MATKIRRATVRVIHGLMNLPSSHRDTFQRSACQAGLLERGLRLYRYGSTERQASTSLQDWVNLSEDIYRTSEDVIQKLCLLDFTGSDLGERDSRTGAKLPATQPASGWKPSSGTAPTAWNVAAWRAEFEVSEAFYAWFGLAGPMAFDVFTGKRYRGPGDSIPHVSRPGGGSQVLVHRSQMPRLRPIHVVQIPRVKHLH